MTGIARKTNPPVIRAMQFLELGKPLQMVELPMPIPAADQIVVEVSACGVCRTDLHIVDGDIQGLLPIVPGHEIVGRVVAMGDDVSRFNLDDRVGIPWLGSTCGHCYYCRTEKENLCDSPAFTGFTVNGGYATHLLANAGYCFAIPSSIDDVHAAPLLCAGLIGYRAFSMCADAHRIGFYGFGASAHILAQLATCQGREIAAFTRPGDTEGQEFACAMGCVWAGGSDSPPPFELDAAIIFAPAGELIPRALAAVRKGSTVVCAGIHMSDIPEFPYALLWGERKLVSVANLARADGEGFFAAIGQCQVNPQIEIFALQDAAQPSLCGPLPMRSLRRSHDT